MSAHIDTTAQEVAARARILQREARLDRMAELVAQRAERKRHESPPDQRSILRAQIKHAIDWSEERRAHLQTIMDLGRLGNVVAFPPQRRYRSVAEVRDLEMGFSNSSEVQA